MNLVYFYERQKQAPTEWKRGSRTGANGRWAAAAGTFVELAASALVEADAGITDQTRPYPSSNTETDLRRKCHGLLLGGRHLTPCGRKPKDRNTKTILLRTAGAGNQGAYLLKGRRRAGVDPQGVPVLVLL